MLQKMKKNYIIPYSRRFCRTHNGFVHSTLMCVDNMGVVVEHKSDVTPTENDVRGHIIGVNNQCEVLVKANSLEEALDEFINYPESKIGIKHKAWTLHDSESNPIIEYSGCKHMLDKGYLSCQYYAENGEVDNVVCVLDGLSEPPCSCPIQKQIDNVGFREQVSQIGGVWVKTFEKNVIEMEPMINGLKFKRT